jgi:lipoprotein-anchoring transpeptidase ErfK/SrfK
MCSGDPRNRLGPRWLGLHNGIGIHAKRPGPLGIGATDGCLALAPEDAIELFDRVETGTPVIIE